MIARRQSSPSPTAAPEEPAASPLDRIREKLDELLQAARATERVRAARGEEGIEKTEEWTREARLRAALLALVDVHVNQLGLGAPGYGEPGAGPP
jgi:hypothetical protein